ncbi:MAG: hypothetical protein ACNA70_06190, partial [Brevefilum sp.]
MANELGKEVSRENQILTKNATRNLSINLRRRKFHEKDKYFADHYYVVLFGAGSLQPNRDTT